MSAADVMLFEAFESALSKDAAVLDKFPKIKACRQKVQECKKMKEYLANRKNTPFWEHFSSQLVLKIKSRKNILQGRSDADSHSLTFANGIRGKTQRGLYLYVWVSYTHEFLETYMCTFMAFYLSTFRLFVFSISNKNMNMNQCFVFFNHSICQFRCQKVEMNFSTY